MANDFGKHLSFKLVIAGFKLKIMIYMIWKYFKLNFSMSFACGELVSVNGAFVLIYCY